jgi:hypothetical protein
MRALRSSHSLLAAAALCAAAAHPAAAQHAAAPAPPRPSVPPAAADVAPRTVAIYRLGGWHRSAGLPAEVRVADSAGVLVATSRPRHGRAEEPMMVTLIDTDLVLQGWSPSGVFTLRLYRQNEPVTAAELEGRWWLEGRQGELRGTTRLAPIPAPPR